MHPVNPSNIQLRGLTSNLPRERTQPGTSSLKSYQILAQSSLNPHHRWQLHKTGVGMARSKPEEG